MVDSKKKKLYDKNYRETHQEQTKKYQKTYRKKHKGKMRKYLVDYYMKNKDTLSKKDRKNYIKNRDSSLSRAKVIHQKIRTEIIDLLGGKCSNPNCAVIGGMTDIRCLQIDHVNGGGNKEAKRFSAGSIYYKHILEAIKNGSKNYQLLCANCNWIKRCENREYFKPTV